MKTKKDLKITLNRRIYRIISCVNQDPYLEEYSEYKKHKKGYRGYWKSKRLWQGQIRMYRSWKHNRKTQWKN